MYKRRRDQDTGTEMLAKEESTWRNFQIGEFLRDYRETGACNKDLVSLYVR